jgi:hypothetical protein
MKISSKTLVLIFLLPIFNACTEDTKDVPLSKTADTPTVSEKPEPKELDYIACTNSGGRLYLLNSHARSDTVGQTYFLKGDTDESITVEYPTIIDKDQNTIELIFTETTLAESGVWTKTVYLAIVDPLRQEAQLRDVSSFASDELIRENYLRSKKYQTRHTLNFDKYLVVPILFEDEPAFSLRPKNDLSTEVAHWPLNPSQYYNPVYDVSTRTVRFDFWPGPGHDISQVIFEVNDELKLNPIWQAQGAQQSQINLRGEVLFATGTDEAGFLVLEGVERGEIARWPIPESTNLVLFKDLIGFKVIIGGVVYIPSQNADKNFLAMSQDYGVSSISGYYVHKKQEYFSRQSDFGTYMYSWRQGRMERVSQLPCEDPSFSP